MMKRILILDDEDIVREFIRNVLEREGYECSEASAPKEARELLKNTKFDLILCDIIMPGESGLDFSRFCTAEYPETIIILMTGFDNSQAANVAMSIGVYGYLTKPCKKNQLLVAVNKALRHYSLEKEKDSHIENLDTLVHKRTLELQKRVEELETAKNELRKSEMKFRTIFENIHEAYYRADLKGGIIMSNSAGIKLLGYTSFDEVQGIEIKSICVDQQQYRLLRDELKKKGRISNHELQLRRKDGTLVTVLTEAHFLYNNDGTPWATEGTLFDITERQALETQIAHARKLEAVGQLAAGIAHEINTPIQYVGDNTSFIKDSFNNMNNLFYRSMELTEALREGMPAEEYLKKLESAIDETDVDYILTEIPRAIEQSLEGVERVSSIIRFMKEFSHPGVKEKIAVDINRTIENTVLVSRNEWKYVAEMETDLDVSLPLITCLPGEINQVLLNIIINAAQAIGEIVEIGTEEKGVIRIGTHNKGNHVEIRISDTGPGIPEEIQSRIFDPFFTTKAVGKGTGQGLAISRSVIVEKHHGDLFFETKSGNGTTFVIHLPLHNIRTKSSDV